MPLAPAAVLIGPAGAGKSTVGALVAQELRVPFVDADAACDPFYAEAGWSIERLIERIGVVGRRAAEVEWEAARAHAVTRLVATSPGAVVALGAGHTAHTRPEHRAAVRAALAGLPVLLLLPDADPARALEVLRTRCRTGKGTDWIRDGHDFLAGWLADPELRRLATEVVVTGDEDPAATAARVAHLVRRPPPALSPPPA